MGARTRGEAAEGSGGRNQEPRSGTCTEINGVRGAEWRRVGGMFEKAYKSWEEQYVSSSLC
eukprot:1412952-Pleurochrysis_carterae.AAC.1